MSELYHENNEIDETFDDVYYNLMEDIRCLKEDLESANQRAEEAEVEANLIEQNPLSLAAKLAERVIELKASLADKDKELESLRERLRWRKYPDEKPRDGQKVIFRGSIVTYLDASNAVWEIDRKSIQDCQIGDHWLPLPTESPDTG